MGLSSSKGSWVIVIRPRSVFGFSYFISISKGVSSFFLTNACVVSSVVPFLSNNVAIIAPVFDLARPIILTGLVIRSSVFGESIKIVLGGLFISSVVGGEILII